MHQRSLLILSTITIVLIWQVPYGRQILYPLTLLATFAHEMGHGLTAMLAGEQFDQLLLNADGSGMALWRGNPGRLATALIAAGGLAGPSVAGISLLLLSRSQRFASTVLATLAVLLVVSVAIWVRNTFGVVFLLSTAAVLALAAKVLPAAIASFVLHLMAATLCLSWFTDLDYMFSAQATVNGMVRPSDSAAIADALWLPYWFWGGVVACFSLAVAALGIGFVSRGVGPQR
ncbi:M50 family metallopeptidase [Rhodoferax sp.]|uniref:M50 family metallopeptidase n=1 Tax=Rhodoferax sp. TaxID=50421 RepID=UPI002768FD27|nr:M50 family metallopeptidase [Rhodoferax sp.]